MLKKTSKFFESENLLSIRGVIYGHQNVMIMRYEMAKTYIGIFPLTSVIQWPSLQKKSLAEKTDRQKRVTRANFTLQ